MATTFQWKAFSGTTSGISAASMSAGVNLLGSEIDNSSNLDRFAKAELRWTCSATASSAGTTVELYFIYALDGSNYEDGAAGVDPNRTPDWIFRNSGTTAAQRRTSPKLDIDPFKFKPLIKSELSQKAVSVYLTLQTGNDQSV